MKEIRANGTPEAIVSMVELKGCIFVAAGNKVYQKSKDSDEFVQMTFVILEEEE